MKHQIILVIFLVMWFLSEVNANEFMPSHQTNVIGKVQVKELPWWADTLASIKVQGGLRIRDMFFRRPETTTNLSVRSSLRLSRHTRFKLKVGEDNIAEMIRYGRENREYYLMQRNDDSLVGYRVRFK